MAKVVVLDVDGTLMDTNYLHTEAWARAFEETGHRVPREKLHKEIGKGAELLIRQFVDDDDVVEEIQNLHSEFYEGFQKFGHPLPGAKELLSSLKERGYEVWFVTSAKDEELEHHMQELEAEDNIAGVVNSSSVDNPKPAPDIFEEALRRAGTTAEETVALGDARWDVEAAKSAGIRTVAVLSGGAFHTQDLEEAGAVAVYEDCAAVLESDFPE
ncbi:MAG TPA: HAD family hydrolase [Rubrobacter sp.]|jgi:HAD superfamily hydrolase (TIGR01509 family)|nr:HAD family hydrolase [Rubrobacter sp.]